MHSALKIATLHLFTLDLLIATYTDSSVPQPTCTCPVSCRPEVPSRAYIYREGNFFWLSGISNLEEFAFWATLFLSLDLSHGERSCEINGDKKFSAVAVAC